MHYGPDGQDACRSNGKQWGCFLITKKIDGVPISMHFPHNTVLLSEGLMKMRKHWLEDRAV